MFENSLELGGWRLELQAGAFQRRLNTNTSSASTWQSTIFGKYLATFSVLRCLKGKPEEESPRAVFLEPVFMGGYTKPQSGAATA
jgi:hypothetical protein